MTSDEARIDLDRCKASLLSAVTERDQLRTENTDLKYRLDLQVRDAIALQAALAQNVAYDQRATESAWDETRKFKAALSKHHHMDGEPCNVCGVQLARRALEP